MTKGIIIETQIKQAIAKGEGRAGIHLELDVSRSALV